MNVAAHSLLGPVQLVQVVTAPFGDFTVGVFVFREHPCATR